jgi:hypothetical protein
MFSIETLADMPMIGLPVICFLGSRRIQIVVTPIYVALMWALPAKPERKCSRVSRALSRAARISLKTGYLKGGMSVLTATSICAESLINPYLTWVTLRSRYQFTRSPQGSLIFDRPETNATTVPIWVLPVIT